MKTAAWCAGFVAAILAILLFGGMPFSGTVKPAPLAPVVPKALVPKPEAPRETVILPVAENAASLNSPETTAEEDIATLDFLISNFRKHEGGNPVGENDEITAALLGRNPKGLGYLRRDRAYIDPAGRLIDRWGTPYFFHAVSGDEMEVVSAGPDLRHHTDDDITSE
jgi:hypothetical protein